MVFIVQIQKAGQCILLYLIGNSLISFAINTCMLYIICKKTTHANYNI